MTLIDQRILIDAPPHIVWDFIADPARITRWHTAYRSISVLTTQQTGLGTRRRCTMADGSKDTIEEITAWVEGLGYEYTLIEGGPYRSFRGRLRLTAGPDGTTVQWTVTYRPRGVFRGFADLLRGRREMQTTMADGLRRLRRLVDELGLRMDTDYRQRVSMRGRLNHSERLEYQRRHVSEAGPGEAPAVAPGVEVPAFTPAPPAPLPPAAVPEPDLTRVPLPPQILPPAPVPVVPVPATPIPAFVGDLLTAGPLPDEDPLPTKAEPRPPVGLRDVLAVFEAPPPLEDLPAAPPPALDDTPFRPPTRRLTPSEPEPGPSAQHAVPEAPAPAPEHSLPTPPRGIPAIRRQPVAEPVESVAEPLPETEALSPAPLPPEVTVQPDVSASAPTPPRGIPSVASVPPMPLEDSAQDQSHLPPPTPVTDTGDLSIWEIFGVRRPSERDAEALEELISSVGGERAPKPGARTQGSRRSAPVQRLQLAVGLRARLARDRVRLRHSRSR